MVTVGEFTNGMTGNGLTSATSLWPPVPIMPDAVWKERLKAAGIIGFLKGCLDGAKYGADEQTRERIDAALKHVEEMELRSW